MGLALDVPAATDEVVTEGELDFIVRPHELEEFRRYQRGFRVHFRPNPWVGAEFLVTPR